MKRTLLNFCAVLVLLTGCKTWSQNSGPNADSDVQKLPFSLSIVPETSRVEPFGRTIAMGKGNSRNFYVVLTNVSAVQQSVWESWNSWGYQAVTVELTTEDGKKFRVSRRQQGFTRNFPSTFLLEPGEHHVIALRLDEWWEVNPPLPKVDEEPVKLKAIYEVAPTPESSQYKVWTGRLESRTYDLKLRQW